MAQKDIDNGSFITDRIVYHEDRHFAVTGKNLIKGDVIERRMNGIAQIRRYNLEMVNAGAAIINCLNTKCERNQLVRVLAATNDDSKVFYACEDSVPSALPKNKPIYVKNSNEKSNTGDQFVTIIANIPEFIIMSPDDKHTVHFVSKTKTVEVLNVSTGQIFVNPQLGGDFDFSTIKNVAFSEDGKLIYVINVKDCTGSKQATIRSINYEKLLRGDKKFLGKPLDIEFRR